MNIRIPTSNDLSAIKCVLQDTDLFPPALLDEMIEPFLNGSESQEQWLVCESDDAGVIGFTYTRPEPFADGAWNLLAIGVRAAQQGKGYGARLLAEVEQALEGERILIVETSGSDDFEATRVFYEGCGYTREATIRDYWADGDDKVIYWKSLEASARA
ncbi:MAG: GNAT family N-acetyltransferase [Pseudomonadota bacterium]